ncbi:MAG: GTPase Era [Cytophagales bacterium]|nr:GTPase Era [Cytophagales bacterium]
MENSTHKSGFVSIIGKPNVGKSTLMNVLVGERLSIITSKAQTTRHRIQGIINGDDYQIVYSDTPGIIKPKYELHKSMMSFVNYSLEDADVILFITDIYEKYDEDDVLDKLKNMDIPVILLVNKVDQVKEQGEVVEKVEYWKEKINPTEIFPISALEKFNTELILPLLIKYMPEHPPFYSKDALTTRPERFFASEIIREQIFLHCKKEVPYSTEVVITDFIEESKIIRIRAEILVERDSQKGILIGKQGRSLKRIGTDSRKQLENFFAKKVFLEQYVKVEPDWRLKKQKLTNLGYNQ